jgi:spermidine synthase
VPEKESRTYPVLLALFFLSGACGLVYQVVWLRKLSLVFGTTTFAVSAVISSFMAGLGLGSYLSGRYLAHRGRALRLFGMMEVGVGLYALALPGLLSVVERSFTRAVGGLGLTVYGESLLKLGLSFVVLLLPTSLMGATLPLLAEHTVERFAHLGTRVGRLYALNTLGAAVGCFVAGFAAIPMLGVMGTTWAAAALNFTVGAIAILLGRKRPAPEAEAQAEGVAAPPALYGAATLRWAIVAFAVSGFAGLGLEVVWTRLITLIFTGTTYAFTTMLTVYLVGIAAGSLAIGRAADRSPDPLRLFGMLEIAIGVSVVALAPLFPPALGWVFRLAPALGGGWIAEAAAKFVVAAVLLILPTFLFGTTFPVVSRVAARSLAGLGATVGRLYAANVAGGIAGGVAAGFVLVPLLGTDDTLRTLCGALMMLGLILVAASPLATARAKGAAAGLAASGAALALVTGQADVSQAIHRRMMQPGESVVFYREGAEATVVVIESPAAKRILVNGSQATNTTLVGRSINRLQGVLPFLFERMPRRVLAICFGSGMTFGTVSEFPSARVDGVEIAPQVIQAAGLFRRENYDVLHNPRFTLHLDDGRNFLLKSRDRYDAITMEPMHPAKTGVVNFYTRDFYALCRAHLEPGGVLSQWVPLYNLQPSDVRMLYRSFAESFPHALVFLYGFDTFLVGSDRPLDLSAARFLGRMPSARLRQDLALLALDTPGHMLATFLMGRDAMGRFAGAAPVVSDDRPLVEYTGPKSLNAPDTVPTNLKALMPYAEPATRYLGTGPGAGADDPSLREELDSLFVDRDRMVHGLR